MICNSCHVPHLVPQTKADITWFCDHQGAEPEFDVGSGESLSCPGFLVPGEQSGDGTATPPAVPGVCPGPGTALYQNIQISICMGYYLTKNKV